MGQEESSLDCQTGTPDLNLIHGIFSDQVHIAIVTSAVYHCTRVAARRAQGPLITNAVRGNLTLSALAVRGGVHIYVLGPQ